MTDTASPLDTGDALACLARRHSVGPKHLHPPAPGPEALAAAIELAQRAPDHEGLQPWRFVQVLASQRPALAALFSQDAQARGQSTAEVAAASQRAHNGAALLALVCRIQPGHLDVPAHEQWLCAGAALMNLLNGLHLQGFGAKVLSGASVRAPAIQDAFCKPGEQLVAWVVAGSLSKAPQPRARGTARAAEDAKLTLWHGPMT